MQQLAHTLSNLNSHWLIPKGGWSLEQEEAEDNWGSLLWLKGLLPLFQVLGSAGIFQFGAVYWCCRFFFFTVKQVKCCPLPWRDAQTDQSEPRTLSRDLEHLADKAPSFLLFLSVTPRIHSSHPKHSPNILPKHCPRGCSWFWWCQGHCSALSVQQTKILHLFFQRSPTPPLKTSAPKS